MSDLSAEDIVFGKSDNKPNARTDSAASGNLSAEEIVFGNKDPNPIPQVTTTVNQPGLLSKLGDVAKEALSLPGKAFEAVANFDPSGIFERIGKDTIEQQNQRESIPQQVPQQRSKVLDALFEPSNLARENILGLPPNTTNEWGDKPFVPGTPRFPKDASMSAAKPDMSTAPIPLRAKVNPAEEVIAQFMGSAADSLIDLARLPGGVTGLYSIPSQAPVSQGTTAGTVAGVGGRIAGSIPTLAGMMAGFHRLTSEVTAISASLGPGAQAIVADTIKAYFTADTLKNLFNNSVGLKEAIASNNYDQIRDTTAGVFFDTIFSTLLLHGNVKDAKSLRDAIDFWKLKGGKAEGTPKIESSPELQKSADEKEVKLEVAEVAKEGEKKTKRAVETPEQRKERMAKVREAKKAKAPVSEQPVGDPDAEVFTPTAITPKHEALIRKMNEEGKAPDQIAFAVGDGAYSEGQIRSLLGLEPSKLVMPGKKVEPVRSKIEQTTPTPEAATFSEPSPREIKVLDKINPDWYDLSNEEIGKLVDGIRAGNVPKSREIVSAPKLGEEPDLTDLEKPEATPFKGAFAKTEAAPVSEEQALLDAARAAETAQGEGALSAVENIAKSLGKKVSELSEEDIDKFYAQPREKLEQVDIDTGSKDPGEVESPYRTTADVTKAQANNYKHSPVVASSIEELTDGSKSVMVTTHKLINDINRSLDGDSTVNHQASKDLLSDIAADPERFKFDFVNEDGTVNEFDFADWKKYVQGGAEFGRKARQPVESFYDGTTLHMFVDPTRLPGMVKDLFNKIGPTVGKTVKEIFDSTGFFFNPYDRRWRYELDDSQIDWKMGINDLPTKQIFSALANVVGLQNDVKLSDVMDHPTLFEAYPKLKDVKVTKQSSLFDVWQASQGWYDEANNTLNITPYVKDFKGTIIHEIQHWVQYKEGWAMGGNVEKALEHANDTNLLALGKKVADGLETDISLKEYDIKDTQDRINLLLKVKDNQEAQRIALEWASVENSINNRFREYMKLKLPENFFSFGRGKELSNKKQQLINQFKSTTGLDSYESIRILSEAGLAVDPFFDKITWELVDKRGKAQRALNDLKTLETELQDASDPVKLKARISSTANGSFEAYKVLAGEIEARDAASRREYTAEERLKLMPLTSEIPDPNSVIVHYGRVEYGRIDYTKSKTNDKNYDYTVYDRHGNVIDQRSNVEPGQLINHLGPDLSPKIVGDSGSIDAKGYGIERPAGLPLMSRENSLVRLNMGLPMDQAWPVMKNWYSALRKYAEEKLPNSALGSQILATLRKGSTNDEWNAIGLGEILDPNKKYSKEEITKIIDEGTVEFKDRLLAPRYSEDLMSRMLEAHHEITKDILITDNTKRVYGEREDSILSKYGVDKKTFNEWLDEKDIDTQPKFSTYQEPGGKNYVELFVTAPKVGMDEYPGTWTEFLNKSGYSTTDTVPREILIKLTNDYKNKLSGIGWEDGHSDYSDIENPVVRLRMNERVDASGNKVLFIEEMQPPNPENQARMPTALQKRWREIGMKRAVKYAIDGGFDKVAWTTGEMQLQRYPSIRSQVRSIDYQLQTDGKYKINILPKGSEEFHYLGRFTKEQLPEAIGLENAKRVIEKGVDPEFKEGSVQGDDLQDIGGEGLRKLYDQDLPNVAKKLGGKVEEINLFDRSGRDPSNIKSVIVDTKRKLQTALDDIEDTHKLIEVYKDSPIKLTELQDRLRGLKLQRDDYIASVAESERLLSRYTAKGEVQSFSVSPLAEKAKGGFALYGGIPWDSALVGRLSNYVNKAFEHKSLKLKEALERLKKSSMTGLVDISGNIKQELIRSLGQPGYEIVQSMVTSKGGSAYAALMFRQMEKEVYGGLGHGASKVLDKLILADRMLAIEKSEKGKSFHFPTDKDSGATPEDARDFMKKLAILEQLHPEDTKLVRARAQAYSDWMRKIANDMYKAGLIGEQELKDLTENNYRRLKSIDEIYDKQVVDKTIGRSVYDSGVQHLAAGKKADIYEPSSRVMALEVMNRAYGRIFKNAANKELLALARADSKNDFVRIRSRESEALATQPTERRQLIDSINIKRDSSTLSDFEYRAKMKKQFKTTSMKDLTDEQLGEWDKTLGPNSFGYVKAKAGEATNIPKGWKPLFVYENGQRRTLRISPEMYKEWIMTSPEMTHRLSQTLRWASGSQVLRTFATGINWAFALRNLPRDVMHIWFSARQFSDGKWESVYSPVLPKATAELGADAFGVFRDAMFRGRKWQDFIAEGGGMEWLTHQGRITQKGRFVENWGDKIYDVLGYFGETSEILSRLALRDRVIKNRAAEQGISYDEAYKDPKIRREATFVARDYMDFNQGGSMTKAADTVIPYLNATVQGTRGLIRSFGKDTAFQSTVKLAQLATIVTGVYLARQYYAPNAHEQLKNDPADVNNLCIPLPESYAYLDDNNQKVYPFIKIPFDNGQRFFKSVFEAGADVWLGKEANVGKIGRALTELNPVGLSNLPPALSMPIGYLGNVDLWKLAPVYKGEGGAFKNDASQEYIPGRTPQAFVDFGAATGMSPERTKYMLGELFANGGEWAMLMDKGYDMLKGMPSSQKRMQLTDVLSKIPAPSVVVGVTKPYMQWSEMIGNEKEKDRFNRLTQNNLIDSAINGYTKGNMSYGDVMNTVYGFREKDIRERLKDRFKFAIATQTLPNRSFWLSLRGAPTEVKAGVYLNRMSGLSGEKLNELKMEEIQVKRAERRIKSSQFSIFSDAFYKELSKQRMQRR